MLDEPVEEWILWAAINSIDPLLRVDVEETIFIIFGQHSDETICEFGVIDCRHCYLLCRCKILKPKI